MVDFKKEVEIMAQLRHPNVLLFMGACTDPGDMAIVTELLTGGNGEQVAQKKNMSVELILMLFCRLDKRKTCL
jgi:serine/threonine protein kinase